MYTLRERAKKCIYYVIKLLVKRSINKHTHIHKVITIFAEWSSFPHHHLLLSLSFVALKFSVEGIYHRYYDVGNGLRAIAYSFTLLLAFNFLQRCLICGSNIFDAAGWMAGGWRELWDKLRLFWGKMNETLLNIVISWESEGRFACGFGWKMGLNV